MTTVSYPVMKDDELMGVAAVSVPVNELAQLAHSVNVSIYSIKGQLYKSAVFYENSVTVFSNIILKSSFFSLVLRAIHSCWTIMDM